VTELLSSPPGKQTVPEDPYKHEGRKYTLCLNNYTVCIYIKKECVLVSEVENN
jgi:hypothetical protein